MTTVGGMPAQTSDSAPAGSEFTLYPCVQSCALRWDTLVSCSVQATIEWNTGKTVQEEYRQLPTDGWFSMT